MLRATATSWTGSSSIPSGRCRSSPSSGATSTTTNAPTAPWAIALLLQRPSSPPLLQALSMSHDLWYTYWGQVKHRAMLLRELVTPSMVRLNRYPNVE